MEVTYDFTNGRILSRNSGKVENLSRLIGLNFPWDYITKLRPINSENELNEDDVLNALFFTGDSKRIKHLDMMSKLLKGSNCERCGSDITLFPWEYRTYGGLCELCNKQLDDDYGPDMFGIYSNKDNVEDLWWL